MARFFFQTVGSRTQRAYLTANMFGLLEVEAAIGRTFAPGEDGPGAAAHWVLPTAAYVEKDGTFVNCHGRVQRIGRAFAPLEEAREDWRILLDLAGRLGQSLDWLGPQEIFDGLAKAPSPFEGLSYETIGAQGASVATASSAAETVEP